MTNSDITAAIMTWLNDDGAKVGPKRIAIGHNFDALAERMLALHRRDQIELASRCRPAVERDAKLRRRDVYSDAYAASYKPTLEREAERAEKLLDDIDAIIAGAAPQPHVDTERMNWLEMMVVEARQPGVHGSFHLFTASPVSMEGEPDNASDIRAQIDYQRNGGSKP